MASDNVDLTRLEAFGGVAVIAVTERVALSRAVDTVSRVVAEFDRACSRFRADSELSALNAAAGVGRSGSGRCCSRRCGRRCAPRG